jgi:hypothetical protein
MFVPASPLRKAVTFENPDPVNSPPHRWRIRASEFVAVRLGHRQAKQVPTSFENFPVRRYDAKLDATQAKIEQIRRWGQTQRYDDAFRQRKTRMIIGCEFLRAPASMVIEAQ